MAVSIKGKVVLVTGASSGVGWAAALQFAALGAKVVGTARRADRLEALCAEIAASGGEAAYLAGDGIEEATAIAAVKVATDTFGTLDILINNAGIGNYKNLVDTSVEEYDAMMDANVRSGFCFSRHAAPVMIAQQSGTILFVSSIAGLQGYGGEAVYCATKFAQVGFAQALDAELRKYNIKVGVLCPGGIKTEFALGKGRTEDSVSQSNMMDAADVADAVVYCCTTPANFRVLDMTMRHMG